MRDGFERWCCGLRQVGERRLADVEARQLASAIARARRNHSGYRWFMRVAVAAVAVGLVLFAVAVPPQGTGKMIAGFVMASVGAVFPIAGVAGALGEVIFGFNLFSRVVFGLALAIAGTTIGLGVESEVAETAASICGIFVILAGPAMFILRIVAARRAVKLADGASRDLAFGRVALFAGQTEAVGQEDEDDSNDLLAGEDPAAALPDFEHHTLDVLPTSGVIVRADGELAQELTSVPIDEIATAGDSLEAPAAVKDVAPAQPGVAVLQRNLRSAEKDELGKLSRRALRNAFVSSAGVFWLVAIVARGLDRALTGWTAAGLSTHALWGTLAVVALYLAAQLNRWRLLRWDLREGKVLVARAEGADLDFSLEETLAQSGALWTQFGQPAAWRLG